MFGQFVVAVWFAVNCQKKSYGFNALIIGATTGLTGSYCTYCAFFCCLKAYTKSFQAYADTDICF